MSTEIELATAFMEAHPEAAALSFEQLPEDLAIALLSEVPAETAAPVITRMASYFAVSCLCGLEATLAGELIGALPLDHSALLLRRMPHHERNRLLDAAPAGVSAKLHLLLRYPEKTAGALMEPAVLALPEDVHAGEALDRVRKSGARIFYYLYVVDRDGMLVGVMSLRELISADEDSSLAEIMHRHVARIAVYADPVAISAHPGWLEFHALPVVDDHGLLVGGLRHKTLRAAGLDDGRSAPGPSPLAAGLAVGELYWSTLGQLLQTMWPAANSESEIRTKEKP